MVAVRTEGLSNMPIEMRGAFYSLFSMKVLLPNIVVISQ